MGLKPDTFLAFPRSSRNPLTGWRNRDVAARAPTHSPSDARATHDKARNRSGPRGRVDDPTTMIRPAGPFFALTPYQSTGCKLVMRGESPCGALKSGELAKRRFPMAQRQYQACLDDGPRPAVLSGCASHRPFPSATIIQSEPSHRTQSGSRLGWGRRPRNAGMRRVRGIRGTARGVRMGREMIDPI